MKHPSLLALLIFGAPLAFAQSLTLQDALQTVSGSSPGIQKASSEANEAYWHKVESFSAFLPKISGQATYITDYKYLLTDIALPGSNTVFSIPGIIPTTTYAMSAEYNVFDGFASTNRLRASMQMEKAANRQLDWAKFQTEREVTLQFYRALAAKTLKQVAESNLKTLQDHLRDVTLLKSNGLSTKYDLLRVEVQVSEATSEVLNSADDVDTATGHLAELMGQANVIDPRGELPEPPADLLEHPGKLNDSSRADLEALGDKVTALRYQKYASDVYWLPRVGLFGQVQYYNNLNDHYDDWGSFRNAYSVGINLTWNLFEGFAGIARQREAVEKEIQTQKSLRISQLKAQQDVGLWARKYKYFHSVYRARQNDIGKARESVRLAKEGRRVGSRTNTDFLDAETDLFRSQAGAVKAQLGIIEALINLELSTGRKLYDFR
jgi:outer membrane protein TolC